MTRNTDRDNSLLTDVKVAIVAALLTAFLILLTNATPGWSADPAADETRLAQHSGAGRLSDH